MQTTLQIIPTLMTPSYFPIERCPMDRTSVKSVNTFEGISEMSSFIKGRNLGSDGDNLAGNSRAALRAVGNLCSVNRSVVDEGRARREKRGNSLDAREGERDGGGKKSRTVRGPRRDDVGGDSSRGK